MLWLNHKRNDLFYLFALFLTSLLPIFPLLRRGFFSSDDGEWMIIRFSAFHQALAQGQFPVRFLSRLNHEYGYPVANFLYPGFMYLAEIPKVLGFGYVDSIKIIFAFSIVGSLIFTYLWLSRIFDKLSAVLGGLIFLYLPYHLFDLYGRGSVGEVLALAVIPFILWQIERESLLWSTLGIAFLLVAHNTLALIFFPILVCYMVVNIYVAKKRGKLINTYIHMLILGLQISAFFWLPAIFDLQYTVFSQTQVGLWSRYFVSPDLIGLSTIAIFLTIFALFLYGKIQIAKHRLTTLFFIVGVVSLLLSISISVPLWKVLPVSFIQFPFRFLSITILCAAFLAACAASVLPKTSKTLFIIGILGLTLFSSRSFIAPSEYFDKGEGFYSTNQDTTTVHGEYMPKWVKIVPLGRPKEPIELMISKGKISELSLGAKQITFKASMDEPGVLRLNKVFFPGWEVFINGKEDTIFYANEKGVMDVLVPRGENNVIFVFKETRVRTLSDIVSLIGFLSLTLLVKKRYEKLHQK